MPVAIVTKYLGPTNYRGSRIRATVPERVASARRHEHSQGECWAHRDNASGQEHFELYRVGHWTLTIPYPHELSGEDVHRKAAQALADRLEWTGALIGGGLDDGYAFTFAPAAYDPATTLEAAMTGPTAGATAHRLAPLVVEALTAAGYALLRLPEPR